MTGERRWKYQIRLNLAEKFAAPARCGDADPQLQPLMDVLKRHHTRLICQYDAFAGYVAEAEQRGPEEYPLYEWTKATIEDAEKRQKYLRSFSLYAAGQEVYDKDIADALKADLEPLIGGAVVTHLRLIDTNPANNPQPPKKPVKAHSQ